MIIKQEEQVVSTTDIIEKTEDGRLIIASQACELIKSFEENMKAIKAQYDEYKEALLTAMMEHGIDKIDTKDFVVNFIESHERESVDSKKLKSDYPEIYKECKKTSTVKPSVRVKLK